MMNNGYALQKKPGFFPHLRLALRGKWKRNPDFPLTHFQLFTQESRMTVKSGEGNMDKKKLDEILRQHEEWTESFEERGKMADLSEVNLLRANLSGANLLRANLSRSDLSEADLSGADLSEANLILADLSGADLSEANLSGANLLRAKLSEANLLRVNLSGANLLRANLSGADLSGADLSGANLVLADLSGVYLRLADFRKASLRGARLCQVTVGGTDFSDTDLTAIEIDRKSLVQIPNAFRKVYENTWVILKDESLIERFIEFPPGCHEAGMSILNYFGTVVRQKYKNIAVGVIIRQDGPKVTMIIETPEGERQKIERTLEEYGLVLKGLMLPEEFLADPLQVMALRNKLEIAQMELRQTSQLFQFAEKQYGERIMTLEEEVRWLRSHVGDILQHSHRETGDVSVKVSPSFTQAENVQGGVQTDSIGTLTQTKK